ncbi:hypothetical protein [Williamsia sterculiae]|uniref:Mce-associated membrane protein n=1 Tax=Williamsia sterculiae TaxID=1344003 RepID=A0A1N7GQA8_9NOCA|nr:hypothetical protein [Williamsia sterculiae]SIS14774.1 hypothetical protein SAMN05445060_2990 [Williamsia sterculiae]
MNARALSAVVWSLTVVSVVAVVAAAVIVDAASWWLVPAIPAVVVTVGAALVVARGGASMWLPVAGMTLVICAATTAVAVAGESEDRPRTDPGLVAAASDAVGVVFTFSPDGLDRARVSVDAWVTDPLRTDYRVQGPDVVLPAAVETRATMSTTVTGAAVDRRAGDTARVLVFADQTISVPQQSGGSGTEQVVPITRWAIMRRVDDRWLLAELQTVGPGGT